jgi:lactate dehydrogenase-like 2-hydroxyacid dehydrogenase
MRMLISRTLPPSVMTAAETRFEVTARNGTGPMSEEECIAALASHDVMLVTLGDALTGRVFDAVQVPRRRLIANFGVGYNHIDVAAAHAKGIAVTNTPGAVTDATADIAMTLILMTARRAGEGERLLRAGAWTGWHPVQMLGLHVTAKRLGVIGMGRIGQAVARRCHFGFGMDVAYASRSEKALDFPATRLDLPDLMACCDIIVVAVPAAPETRHLIDARALAMMQPHAILVNIARGDIVDEAALIAGLQAGQLGGAGLDVYEFEPTVPRALMEMENVTLLPHLGTAALEVREAMGQMALANAVAFAENRPLLNPV